MHIASPLTTESEPCLQWIELASSFQIPGLYIIGLPAPEVAEARERIRAAIDASGFEFPKRRLLINLSPASIKKRGTGLDLAMALAVLSSTSSAPLPGTVAAWGELGLDGSLKPSGQLARSLFAAWKAGVQYFLLAEAELKEARRVRHLIQESREFSLPPPILMAASNLKTLWNRLAGGNFRELHELDELNEEVPPESALFEDSPALLPISPSLKRTLCTSAAGAHHLLLLGPRGSGKTHALDWLIALQPSLSKASELKNRLVSELSGLPLPSHLKIPIRRVGPQVRPAALTGGSFQGALKAGDFSLAHGGLLIADEFPEWARDSREALRDPLERGKVCINRIHVSVELPARFTLAATGNFCPCGGTPLQFPRALQSSSQTGDTGCRCKKSVKENYLARLSGPVLDRLDLVSFLLPTPASAREIKTDLASLQEKVVSTQQTLIHTYGDIPSRLNSKEIDDFALRKKSVGRILDLSPLSSFRSRHKTIRVAMTLAALDEETEIKDYHLQEALFYRPERLGLFS